MITEDYVSFETAKLLKEKGFDEYTLAYYDETGVFEYDLDLLPNGLLCQTFCSAPTLQMAMKWLREEKHLQICVSSYPDKWEEYIHGWQFLIKKLTFTEGLGWNWDDSFGAITDKKMSDDMTHETYEETCEAAIKHCLENLI